MTFATAVNSGGDQLICQPSVKTARTRFAERADDIPLGDLGDPFVGRDLVDGFAGMRPVRRRQIQPGLVGEALPARGVPTASGVQHRTADRPVPVDLRNLAFHRPYFARSS